MIGPASEAIIRVDPKSARALGLLGREVAEALGAEFVLLDLEGQLPFFLTGDAAAGDQVQQAPVIELRGPTDGNLEPGADGQFVRGGKQNAGAADVEGLSDSIDGLGPLTQGLIAQFPFNRKTTRTSAFRARCGAVL